MNTPVHEYISTKQEFGDAQRLHRKNRPRSAANYCLWYAAIPIASLQYLVYFSAHWFMHPRAVTGNAIFWAAIALYLAVLLTFARWWQMR